VNVGAIPSQFPSGVQTRHERLLPIPTRTCTLHPSERLNGFRRICSRQGDVSCHWLAQFYCSIWTWSVPGAGVRRAWSSPDSSSVKSTNTSCTGMGSCGASTVGSAGDFSVLWACYIWSLAKNPTSLTCRTASASYRRHSGPLGSQRGLYVSERFNH
jgi:hypothetical protein